MKRRKGLACSSPLDQDHSSRPPLKGEVYNIFPFIRDPNLEKRAFPRDRAFTLPGIIDAAFFPFPLGDGEEGSQWETDTTVHEIGHIILSSNMETCEERDVAARLLAKVWNMVIDTDNDVQLLIPSFTIVGPNGKVFELQMLADRLETLMTAREVIHETVACAVQIGDEKWNRDEAKRLIRRVVANNLLDDKTLDDFLTLYEKYGPVGAFLLGHYALNTVDFTQQKALARFKRAIEVVGTFKWKHRDSTSTGPAARLERYLEFLQHLDSNLPDYIMTRCPLAGCRFPCLPRFLEARAEFLENQCKEEGNSVPNDGKIGAAFVYRTSAWRMMKSRCEREEQLVISNNVVIPDIMLRILRYNDKEALSFLGIEREEPTLTLLELIEHENCNYKYTIGLTPMEKEMPLIEISPVSFVIFTLEATLQQMFCGEGPLCLCYPHQPASCSYRNLLQRIWDRTAPDPEWGESNWKLPNKKPPCID